MVIVIEQQDNNNREQQTGKKMIYANDYCEFYVNLLSNIFQKFMIGSRNVILDNFLKRRLLICAANIIHKKIMKM